MPWACVISDFDHRVERMQDKSATTSSALEQEDVRREVVKF